MGNNTDDTRVMLVGIDLSMNASGLSIVLVEDENEIINNWTATNPEPEPLTPEQIAKIAKRKRKPKEPFVFKSNKVIDQKFYLLVPNEPSSSKKYSTSCTVVNYGRLYDDSEIYAITDMSKIASAGRLANHIRKIVISNMEAYNVKECIVRMEGSVMATSFSKKHSRLNDLTAFNSIVKLMLLSTPAFKRIGIVSPAALKKRATGSGAAKKEGMIASFKELHGDNFDYRGKIDDIVDSWFLATCILEDEDMYDKELLQLSTK